MQRIHRDRSEVQRWLQVRERDGVSFAEIARRSGIPTGTLATWARRLRLSEGEGNADGFVRVVADAEPTGGETDERDVVTLRSASGSRIELRGRFAEQFVARALEQLGSWS